MDYCFGDLKKSKYYNYYPTRHIDPFDYKIRQFCLAEFSKKVSSN